MFGWFKKKKPTYQELEIELQTLKSEIVECRHWIGGEFPEVEIVTSYLEHMSGNFRQSNLREDLRCLKRQGLLTQRSASVQKLVSKHDDFGKERAIYRESGMKGLAEHATERARSAKVD